MSNHKMTPEKPVLGIIPEWVWKRDRMYEILENSMRYIGKFQHIPDRNIEELIKLNNEMKTRETHENQ